LEIQVFIRLVLFSRIPATVSLKKSSSSEPGNIIFVLILFFVYQEARSHAVIDKTFFFDAPL